MLGGVIRIRGEAEKTDVLAEALVANLAARGNNVQRLDSDSLFRMGIQADSGGLMRLAARLAEFGIWSVLSGPDVPMEPLLGAVVDVRATCGVEEPGLIHLPEGPDQAVLVLIEQAVKSPFMTGPAVILGKGGSGTRLVSEALRAFGFFLGSKLNETGDSLEMKDVGYVLLHEHTGRDLPQGCPVHAEEIRTEAARMLARGNVPLGAPWGWKLPETMLFAPLVLEAFPSAMVVHLVRHPCGTSLKRELHLTDLWRHHLGRAVLQGAGGYAGLDRNALASAPMWVRAAHSWVYQVERVTQWTRAALIRERLLEIRFEDLQDDPKRALTALAQFLGVRRVPWSPSIEAGRARHWDATSSCALDVWNIAGKAAQQHRYEGP